MSLNRVQKLLFSEYCDFEDMVLVESPFAQTTKDGRGLRQVNLGLTPSKLVIATDVLPPVEHTCVTYIPGIDPDIETFELIAIYPVECVNLSIYRRRKRQAIKAHFCNNRVYYFELGGFEKRGMFWNLWCEKVKFLSPEETGSSHSETSVATSSTNSTLYLIDSKQIVRKNGVRQIWCQFGKSQANLDMQKWTDRYLYLGKNFNNSPLDYKPIMVSPKISQFVKNQKSSVTRRKSENVQEVRTGDSIQINRFGSGVHEGCSTGLFLPAEDYIVERRFSRLSNQSSELLSLAKPTDFLELTENCVKSWENFRLTNPDKYSVKHRRRYGFTPQPLFLRGFGPWNITKGAKFSLQIKRVSSCVDLRKLSPKTTLKLTVPKRQLIATISCETVNSFEMDLNLKLNEITKPVTFFWTPDYWYRPRSAKDSYLEIQQHLKQIRTFQQKQTETKRKRRIFRKKSNLKVSTSNSDSNEETVRKKKRKSISFRMFHNKPEIYEIGTKSPKETQLQYLKRILKMDVTLTVWDFDSTTLAQQLTLIDRDLFLKINGIELSVLIWQQSSKNAPNLGAFIAFAHRINCLVATEILRNESEKNRAKIIARFINVAYKCHLISNFHSCKSVLFGLQSPGVFRLKTTWTYVRKKHATKYQLFEYLSRLYRDPRLLSYQKAFSLTCQTVPYMPFIGDLIDKLLDKIPNYNNFKSTTTITSEVSENVIKQSQITPNMIKKLLMLLKIFNFNTFSNNEKLIETKLKNRIQIKRKIRKYNGLCDYYTPLNYYEDNRVKCLLETTELLKQCQLSAMNYCFNENNLAKDYLLKARYKEDKENFFHSLFVVENKQTY